MQQKIEEERESDDKEASAQQLEMTGEEAIASGTSTRTRTGVFKKLKQRLQRNTQDNKLVSGTS